MTHCPQCGSAAHEGADFCRKCGGRLKAGQPAETTYAGPSGPASTGWLPSVTAAAMLAYASHLGVLLPLLVHGQLTRSVLPVAFLSPFLGSLMIVSVEPYRRDRFARFHAFQSALLPFAAICLNVSAVLLMALLTALSGPSEELWYITMIVPSLWLATSVYVGVRAYGGRRLVLPVIGNIALKLSARFLPPARTLEQVRVLKMGGGGAVVFVGLVAVIFGIVRMNSVGSQFARASGQTDLAGIGSLALGLALGIIGIILLVSPVKRP